MINPMDISGRIFVVTGASSGIGRDVAVFLSELGASIVIVGRNIEQLEKTYKMMSGSGHFVEQFDLHNVDEIPKWLNSMTEKTGPLDGVVHSAGVEALRPFKMVTQESFNYLMNINVNAAVGLTKGFRQKKINRSGGSIVFISSVAGLIGQIGHVEYCASKSALIGLTKSAALELAREKIRVNCVAPGLVATEMVEIAKKTLSDKQLQDIVAYQPLGIGKPRDVSSAVAFLLADTGRWITGTTLVVDGGYTAH
ncbi:MAG: NAD(P)-dependent dehydrogenase, short-chain alcohol dehydrogenase family [Candidatus Electronema aureum]|uniref:NAD(P)-dependent dehydrogenase, short-chain alcohol dehydrogenase family n=1 Tax=Candidatus Electronema aureum TaxID=2005002 RepID=A0A521FZS9_9BACT|nr:MAG: NAD(P)-dependent dehydrogenase, short-chain alcohol dehydrogenase family [Candidatus Electronema aureum]